MPDATRTRSVVVAALLGGLAASTASLGHEGHAPLPTKGVQVDLEKGQLVLSPSAYRALAVETRSARLAPAERSLLAMGRVVADWRRHAKAASIAAGKIVSLKARPGATVDTGEVLAEVVSLEFETLQLELLNAHQEVVVTEKAFRELEPLAAARIVPEREVREVESRLRQAQNAEAVARMKLKGLGLPDDRLDKLLREGRTAVSATLPITSPIAGTIIHVDAAVGQVVDPSEHLFEVVDLSTVRLQTGVLEKDLLRIRKGQRLEFIPTAYPQQVVSAVAGVQGIDLDPVTHLGTVWSPLRNDTSGTPRLMPGMTGQVRVVETDAKPLVTVPAEAVLRDGVERYVLIEEAAHERGREYRRQPVAVVRETPEIVQLAPGAVFPEDRVVTRGAHELAALFFQGVLRVSPEAARRIGLELVSAQPREIEPIVVVDGAFELPPDRRAQVAAQAAGAIRAIHVTPGQSVEKGQILAEIASLEFVRLQADLAQATFQVELHRTTRQRLQGLEQTGVLTRRQLWETELALAAATNRRDTLRLQLRALGLTEPQLEALVKHGHVVEYAPLRAPIAGVVARFEKLLGEVVRAQEAVAEIHDLTSTWVQAHVPESQLAAVRVGQWARVRPAADPAFVVKGVVRQSSHVFDERTRTLSLWIELTEPPTSRLPHGMLAEAALQVGPGTKRLAVPRGGLALDSGKPFLFVRRADGVFERRAVMVGVADDRWVEIVRGVAEGESVVSHGAQDLQTGFAAIK